MCYSVHHDLTVQHTEAFHSELSDFLFYHPPEKNPLLGTERVIRLGPPGKSPYFKSTDEKPCLHLPTSL